MRVSQIDGFYVRYRDSGRPVEVFDKVTYAFTPPTRTCLVQRGDHLRLLLETHRYEIVGVEVPDPVAALSPAPTAPDWPGLAGGTPPEEPEAKPRKKRSAPDAA